jgi:hypothetical protein
MRVFSSTVQNLIDSGNIEYFFLITLNFTNTYRLTSYHSNLEYPIGSGNTYISDGGLFEIDEPKFSSVVDREAYRIVIAEDLDEMSAEFEANVVGKPIDVKVGFIDANGYPLLNENDIVSIYKGNADSPSITNDWEQKLAVIEGTSPMADLDAVNVRYTSKDGMDQINTDDTSFDEIYGGREITFKWGKV